MNTVFAEKYRPKTLDDIVGQPHIIPLMKAFAKKGDIPHMMFVGKPGIGKTTVAKALARDMYGDDWKKGFYELNASDERGIKVIQEKVKSTARVLPLNHAFKIIFLDEGDALTRDAQTALRRIIEDYSEICRFIISCNYPQKIIPALAGERLVEFRFVQLKPLDMKLMLDKVVKAEEIEITSSALSLLATLSDGSMRKALGMLEKFKKGGVTNINDDVIYNAYHWVNRDFVSNLVSASVQGNIDLVDKRLNDMLYNKVYNHKEILKTMYSIVKEADIPIEKKLHTLTAIGGTEFKISMGADPELQLKTLMCNLILLFGKYERN